MLKKIILHNFMSHADTTVDLTEGVNLFVGSSFSGKSAIMDGIFWVISNRPLGDSFVSYWAKDSSGRQIDDTFVTLEFDDLVITRLKGKTENKYIINGNILDAVGTDLPTAVSEAINFSEVNFQHQMDPLFLVSATGGEVAKLLNKTVKLDLIDTFLSSIDSKKRQAKRESESIKKELEDISIELQQYQNLDSIVYVLEKLEHIENICIKNREIYTHLSKMIDDFIARQKAILEQKRISRLAEPILDKIEYQTGTIAESKSVRVTLLRGVEECSRYEQALQKKTFVEAASKLIAKIARYASIVAETKKEKDIVQQGVDTFYRTLGSVTKDREEIKALESSLPKMCPTCGKEL